MKTCSKCKIEKPETEFHKDKSRKDGLNHNCKVCVKEHQQQSERRKLRQRAYDQAHRAIHREFAQSERGKQYQREYMKCYRQKPGVRLAACISAALVQSLKAAKAGRHWETLVGYTVNELMAHLESKFKPGMSWENQGSYWHIDHIKPQSWFDQLNPEQFKECWALENLQPLEATENIRKGNRWEG
jgi:hypothetical protein